MTTNITPEIVAQFEALASGRFDNFALMSCFVNGEPTAAICAVNGSGDDIQISPMFVAITPGMVLEDHDGNLPTN